MGSTVSCHGNLLDGRDHPHIHGEHSLGTRTRTGSIGSPPYTWGAQLSVGRVGKGKGITPIYMGSTDTFLKPKSTSRDHPHIHGEHPVQAIWPTTVQGSPPYTWGALNGIRFFSVRVGITPIYMGSTLY